jgi:outer membrane lipoprotein-sorting protein
VRGRPTLAALGLALAAAGALAAAAGPATDAAPAAPPAAAEPAAPPGLEPAPADLTGRELARRAEEVLRGDTAVMEARMTVESPRLPEPRVVAFRSWDDRHGDRSFIRILSPAKDEGTGFLMRKPNLWMYVPRVERTMRIPPSMMLQSWMGSDFTNDDLVRESSQLDDYDHRLLGVDPKPEGAPGKRAYVVEYRPHEDAPVVWGRIVAWIETDHYTPLRQEFYDESGAKLRIFKLSDVREAEGRWFPHRWEMDPLEKPGHRTVIDIDEIHFDVEIPDRIFTTRNLKG